MNLHIYERIVDLSLSSVSVFDIPQMILFLERFPNLRYLHVHFTNRRLKDGDIFDSLRKIISKCEFLISLKLQIDRKLDKNTGWLTSASEKIKMLFQDSVFDGVLIQFWF